MDSNVTADFIFGTLGTDDRRLAHEKSQLVGLWHGSRIRPLDPVPGDSVTFTVSIGTDITAARVDLMLTRDGSDPEDADAELHPFEETSVEWSTLGWGYSEIWECSVPAPSDELWRYRIRATTENGQTVWADVNPLTGAAGLFAVSIDTESNASWLRDAVIYQVFPDRFARTNSDTFEPQDSLMDIWGGTLQGVIRHLDHIQHLGANAIWLTPIFPSPTHHGYDVTHYKAIEPRLGTLEDFDLLVSEAKRRGIRIILDFVASHTSNEHPAFEEAHSERTSSHREMFIIRDDGTYESFFGVESMPRINGDSDVALDWLIDASKFWLDRGVDGFRLDYAIGQSMQFWTRFRRALRDHSPDVGLIAEAVDSPETLRKYQGRIDSVLDFSWLQQVRLYAAFESISASDFWRFYERHSQWFASGPITVSFLDNHDMNRFLWIVGNDSRKLKLAALLQFSLPSPGVIFYGTEVGLSQWRDLEYPDGSRRLEESRTPMIWGQDQDRELLEFYRSLVFWRKRFGISRCQPRLVHAGDDGLLVFTTDSWLIALNRSNEEVGVDLGTYGSMWLSLATDNGVKLYGSELVLPEYSGAVLANELAR